MAFGPGECATVVPTVLTLPAGSPGCAVWRNTGPVLA